MFTDRDLLFLAADRSLLDHAAGGFARRIFVAVLDEGQSDAARVFLTRVFEAARLDLGRDVLLAAARPGEPVSMLPVLKEKHPEYILVFGLTPAECGFALDVPLYQPVAFYQSNLLFADKISALEPDKAKKGMLWAALKQLFL